MAIAALSVAMVSSCKPEEPNNGGGDTTPAEKGLVVKWNGVFNGTALEYKTGEYTRGNGEIMRVSNWAMILSKVELVRNDDSRVTLGDGYVYVDFVGGKNTNTYATIPAGDYKGISFKLGLDSAINHGDPAVWPAEHPLNGSYTGLHWGWAGGYIFQAIDGNWKASASASTWNGISLHTAGDKFTQTVFVPFNFTLTENRKTMVIEANVEEYFKNPILINFKTDGSFSHSVGSKEVLLMNSILNNMGDVFTVKEVK